MKNQINFLVAQQEESFHRLQSTLKQFLISVLVNGTSFSILNLMSNKQQTTEIFIKK